MNHFKPLKYKEQFVSVVSVVRFFGVVIIFTSCTDLQPENMFEPKWESLQEHEKIPRWLLDAKFGIYVHWGVYSVPFYGNEWYARRMHQKGGGVNQHHMNLQWLLKMMWRVNCIVQFSKLSLKYFNCP